MKWTGFSVFDIEQSCWSLAAFIQTLYSCFYCRMGSALLSRFDLVFILLDTPNEDHDHLLSEHVMAIRAGKQAACSSAAVSRASVQDRSVLQLVSDRPLLERLKVAPSWASCCLCSCGVFCRGPGSPDLLDVFSLLFFSWEVALN